MSPSRSFAAELTTVIAGALFVVANVAFLTVPYTLGGHPGEAIAVAASQHNFHSS